MDEVYIVPPDSDDAPWRIRLRMKDGTRWLASVSEAALAQKLAEDYARANDVRLLPFDAEAWEIVRDLRKTCLKLLWEVRDVDGVGKEGARAFEESFRVGKAPLCERFRKSKKRVRCDGCPIQLVSGLDDCRAFPVRKACLVAASNGVRAKSVASELLQTVICVLDMTLDHMTRNN